jgi:hypothetical protein
MLAGQSRQRPLLGLECRLAARLQARTADCPGLLGLPVPAAIRAQVVAASAEPRAQL